MLAIVGFVSWDGCIGGGRIISSGVGRGSSGNKMEILLAAKIGGLVC